MKITAVRIIESETHGLIEPVVKYEPCSTDECFCSGYVSKAEFESGVTRFRPTELLTRGIK